MDGSQRLTLPLGERLLLLGDDLLRTNPDTISTAIARNAGNAALIKVNQVGMMSEALAAVAECQ